MRDTRVLVFAPFRLDLEAERLWRDDAVVRLTAKAFAVLRYLVLHADYLVTRDEFIEAVWALPFVSEAALTVCIGEIRRALGDTARAPQFLETVRGRGYRFCAPVMVAPLAPGQLVVATLLPGAIRLPGLLVGREAEMAQLLQWWAQAQQGARQVILVTGEAGIGKTTLVDACVAQVVASETVWLGRGQCIEQHGVGEAYLPLLEALGRLGRGPDGARVVTVLSQQAPSWLVHLPGLVPPEAYEALERRAGGTTRERMLRELAEAVEVLTVEQPLVLVLEDLHWSDGATLDWLGSVARRREAARLLVLGTYRPVEAMVQGHPVRAVTQDLRLHGQATEVVLGNLSAAGVATYLTRRFGADALPGGLADVLHQRTDGNPLFLVTVVDDLVQQGVVRQGATGWALVGGLEAAVRGVPESLRQLMEQQLGQLSPTEQALLEAASVAGAEFTAAAVAAVVAQTVDAVEAHCHAFARREQFLQGLGPTDWLDGTMTARYRFRHDLYRELLYERVPVNRRVQWHQQIGARLEAGYGARAREFAAELAAHFVRGRDVPRAVTYLHDAGENALQRSAHQEALTHLHQGLELLLRLPETSERTQQEIALQVTLGAALGDLKGSAAPEVERVYTRAWELCQQAGETPQHVPVLRGLGSLYNVRGQFQTARGLAEQALALAQRVQDAMYLAQAHIVLGNALFYLGELVAARGNLEQSLVLYDPQQHRVRGLLGGGEDLQVFCLTRLAIILWHLGYPDYALQRSHAALMLARELAHPYSLAVALTFAAILHQQRRERHRTHELAAAAVVLASEQGFTYRLAVAISLRAWALVAEGRGEEGIRQMRQSLAAVRATGAEVRQPYWLALLADAYGQVGQREAGLQVLAEALTLTNTHGERQWEAELQRLKGEFLLTCAADQHAAAEIYFQQALDVARQQQAKSLELRAAMSLARLWQRQGKRAAARQLLAEVYGWFTEGFDTADLLEAKALLEELA